MVKRMIVTALTLCLLGAAAAAESPAGPTPLHEAVRTGEAQRVRAALDEGADPDVRWAEYYGATALMLAAESDAVELATVLLDGGADPDVCDANGDTALNWAAYYGWDDFGALLLSAGADPTLTGHGNAYEIALRRGHRPLAARLAEQMGLVIDPDSAAARLEAAVLQDDGAAIAALVADGLPVDAVDAVGQTALMLAARDGRPTAVAALLAAGADPNHASAAEGLALTPLHMAAIGGDPALVRALLAAGAELDRLDRLGNTAALWAFMEQQRDALEVLLAAGADAGRPNDDGDSLAGLAEQYGLQDILDLIAANRRGDR